MVIQKIPTRKQSKVEHLRVAAYARVSTGKDAQLQSVAAQVDYFKKKILSNPLWEFVGVFADDDQSGTKANRPEFQAMLERCEAGEIDLILTKSISRFARNTVDLLNVVRKLKEKKIAVYFEREHIHTTTAEGELLLTLLASFAQEESRSMSQNKRWSVQQQFQRGEVVGVSHLYGYRIKDGELQVEPHEANVVRMIYRDYLSGMSSKEIAAKLNQMGERRTRGGAWKPNDISKLFMNEKHTGNAYLQKTYKDDQVSPKLHRNHGQKPKYLAEGTHEPIIDEDTYRAVRAEVERRTSPKRSKQANVYSFSRRICCAACGANFSRKKTRTEIFWRCGRNLGNVEGKCQMKGVPERVLESLTAEVLGADAFDPLLFHEKIAYIEVAENNLVIFQLRNGTTIPKAWKARSRAESWTPEMRERARQKNEERMQLA